MRRSNKIRRDLGNTGELAILPELSRSKFYEKHEERKNRKERKQNARKTKKSKDKGKK